MVYVAALSSQKYPHILVIVVIKAEQWLSSEVAAQFHQILSSLQELACTISTVVRMPSFLLLQQVILQGSLMQVMILISSVFNKYGDEGLLLM